MKNVVEGESVNVADTGTVMCCYMSESETVAHTHTVHIDVLLYEIIITTVLCH